MGDLCPRPCSWPPACCPAPSQQPSPLAEPMKRLYSVCRQTAKQYHLTSTTIYHYSVMFPDSNFKDYTSWDISLHMFTNYTCYYWLAVFFSFKLLPQCNCFLLVSNFPEDKFICWLLYYANYCHLPIQHLFLRVHDQQRYWILWNIEELISQEKG